MVKNSAFRFSYNSTFRIRPNGPVRYGVDPVRSIEIVRRARPQNYEPGLHSSPNVCGRRIGTAIDIYASTDGSKSEYHNESAENIETIPQEGTFPYGRIQKADK